MDNKFDLTRGPVSRRLLKIALPIVSTQVMQMTYNLTDMFWLGRVGYGAVAASGTAGLYIWLSVGFMLLGRMGAEIGVSQSLGRGDETAALEYSQNAMFIAALSGVLFGASLIAFNRQLVGFFNFQEAYVAADTQVYISTIGISMPLSFVSSVIAGTFNASGDTKTPFIINGAGFLLNMAADPILIFTFGLGVKGAAMATVIAQTAVCVLMVYAIKKSGGRPFETYKMFVRPLRGRLKQILKWTVPIGLESCLFCFLTMLTSRFEVSFGAYAMAVGRVGSQIESLSWLVGGSFGSALTAFVGQNYGAGEKDRVRTGVKTGALYMTCWGIGVTMLLYFAGGAIFGAFLPDPSLTALGIKYLRIIAACQIPMNLEAVAGNAYKGTGRTVKPSVVSITSNIIRVPLAYLLSRMVGLTGVWVAVSATACLRGVWISAWYIKDEYY